MMAKMSVGVGAFAEQWRAWPVRGGVAGATTWLGWRRACCLDWRRACLRASPLSNTEAQRPQGSQRRNVALRAKRIRLLAFSAIPEAPLRLCVESAGATGTNDRSLRQSHKARIRTVPRPVARLLFAGVRAIPTGMVCRSRPLNSRLTISAPISPPRTPPTSASNDTQRPGVSKNDHRCARPSRRRARR